MGWLDGDRKSLECSIKYTKKALVAQISLLVFNLVGIGWNAWWLIYGNGTANAGFGFGLGAFISNTLWTGCFVAKYWGEINSDREQLRYIKKNNFSF